MHENVPPAVETTTQQPEREPSEAEMIAAFEEYHYR